MTPILSKLPRNTFKCFQCRELFTQRDGDWVDWNTMQVHLCHPCDKKTEDRQERADSRAAKRS